MRLRPRHSLKTRLTFSRATPAIAARSARLIFSWSTIWPGSKGVPTSSASSTNARATRSLTDRKVVAVLSENLIRLGSRIIGENHRMIADDVRASAFARNVRCRLVQAAAPACSREPVPPPSTQHRPEACAASSSTARQRPGPAGLDDPALAEPARCGAGRSTGDHPSLASYGFHGVLALEIAQAGRAAKNRSRVARSHPTDEQGKPKVGSISDP